MKKGVRLVNCARGGIIVEEDLAEAVKQGIVAGAAIDVFTSEPVGADHPLVGVPGIVLTPHLGASTVEAQVGVSLDVSEGILAALKGEPVATAVNMAPVSPQVMKGIAPYLTLAERLGGTVASLAEAPVKKVEVTYNGEITEVNTGMLTTAVIKGLLNPIMENDVNYVNAPGLAKERGIKVTEVKKKEAEDFANLITVKADIGGGKNLTVQGTLFGSEARIVRINKFRVDVDPQARILVCPHINKPGVIGTIGTFLGVHGINISGMQVGKTEVEGTSLMVLTVDHDIPASVLKDVKGIDGIIDAKLVNFYAI
jgi:D-3-phosphoglycerate dehydrogenase